MYDLLYKVKLINPPKNITIDANLFQDYYYE